MAIDDKHPSLWTEADLQELCEEQRRETQRLEFKRELQLDAKGQKNDAEHDAHGMANDGGGVIVYGIEERVIDDGGKAAVALRPLTDGTLPARMEELLDSRGEPRLLFELHEVRSTMNGFYLVLDIHARRRPHMSQDGRYYGRRGTRVRQMTEAEVQEAYRDKARRERLADDTVAYRDGDIDLPPTVQQRVHRGLKPNELALWREETGEASAPGWMSVVVFPDPPQNRLLIPAKHWQLFRGHIDIPDRWDPDHTPLHYFDLTPSPDGLFSQLPPSDDAAPAYLVAMYKDGVMEYGAILERGLRHEDPARNRIIFSLTHPQMAHDYLAAFALALGKLDYDGRVGAQVSFENTRGVNLGLREDLFARDKHPIEVEHIRSEVWYGARRELPVAAGRIVKQVMDDVYVAAGLPNGTDLIDDEGNWVGTRT